MNPITFLVLSFGVWIVAKKEAAQYWALATTPNPSGSILNPSGNAKAGTTSPGVVPATQSIGAHVGG